MIEVVGHTAVDHICKVSHLPTPNTSSSVLDRKIFFGGGAANIAAGIAVLGGEAALISAVGGEFAGSDYDRWMDQLKIDKRFFVVPKSNTATAFMFTDTQGAQVTFFEWGASCAFETEPAPKLEFVHMATADPAFNVRVAELASFASFDPGQDIHRYTKEHLQVILENIDILIANQHEYVGMCRTLGISHADLVKQVPIAIETRSGDGCQITEQGTIKTIPAVTVPCADPTGAGDGFRAGFLTAYAEGYDTVTAAKVGTITASFVVEHVGCQTALADRARMETRYKNQFGPLSKPEGPRRA